ncbi:MAG: pilus assembly protein PilM, partial [Lysinibacillus sp.]|nr:pilus assembly protein PilM [Lysinibacillus sp.]
DISQAKVFEVEIPNHIIEESILKDEMALFEIFKEYASKWGGKNQSVRFIVPDSSILLKAFDHPNDVKSNQLREYVEMELGHSIHLPFENPLIDVFDPKEGDGKAMMIAASSEEVNKYINLFLDIAMRPEVADVRALCNLRLLEDMGLLQDNKTYLLTNWLINELSIAIYSNGNLDFQRFQPIGTDINDWKAKENGEHQLAFTYQGDLDQYRMLISDQVLELDKIMNFYRFSLNKGDKGVDEIIIMGDNPNLDLIHTYLQDSFQLPIKMVNDQLIQQHYPGFKAKHVSILGLALKEVKS